MQARNRAHELPVGGVVEKGSTAVRRHMARAGVAVATVASLGVGGGLLVAQAAPAGAVTSASSNGQPGQTVDEAVANTEALVSTVEAEASSYASTAIALACFPLEILLDSGPPYPPPGSCDIG